MGLELGPPWLVLAKNGDAGEAEILLRDNFTGAAVKRLTSARRQETGSFAAVMAKDGQFAVHRDGRVYDPLDETRGRHGGTPAERGHRALLTAEALFREMGGMSWEEASKPPPKPFQQAGRILLWATMGLGVLILLSAAP